MKYIIKKIGRSVEISDLCKGKDRVVAEFRCYPVVKERGLTAMWNRTTLLRAERCL